MEDIISDKLNSKGPFVALSELPKFGPWCTRREKNKPYILCLLFSEDHLVRKCSATIKLHGKTIN